MRASDILRRLWHPVISEIEPRRLRLLLLAINGIVSAATVTLTSIGRALSTATTPKHSIKRIDRLLANRHLRNDMLLLKQTLAKRLVRRERRPIILVDWSLVRGKWWVLCATLPHLGRSLPLHYEVHSKALVGNRRIQTRFLAHLAEVLPVESHPIIVADAGFRTPFFKACDDQTFDFVIRLRGNGELYRYRDHSLSFAQAFAQAGTYARSLGQYEVFRQGAFRLPRNVILGPRPSTRRGHDYQRRRAAEPWLLATSLKDHSPVQIVSIYALRMQIEETFRDAKNPRFGWALSFALIAAILAGAAVEHLGLHRQLQANSTRNRRVLSLMLVGAWALRTALQLSMQLVINRIVVIHHLLRTTRHRRPCQLKLPFPRQFFARRRG